MRNIRSSSTIWRRCGNNYHQPTSQSSSSASSRLGKIFRASRYRTVEMPTHTRRESIGRWRIANSLQGLRPRTPMPSWTLQWHYPRWVSSSTISTFFAGSQEITSGKSSWSSCWTKLPRWLPWPMRSSASSSKRKLQSSERKGALQQLCSFHRKVAKTAEAAKWANVRWEIREIIRDTTIEKGRICRSAFIACSEGMSR